MADLVRYSLTTTNLHIIDSYKIPGRDFYRVLKDISLQNKDAFFFKTRGKFGMCLEWVVQNFLYKINYQREATRDISFNYPQKWYLKISNPIITLFTWPFVL